MIPGDGEDALLARLLAEEGAAASRPPAIPRRTAGTDAPLSFAQRRLWFLDRLLPGNAAYNISAAFVLRGPFDAALFGRSLAAVVARHETLRTVFLAGPEGEPFQRVLPADRLLFEDAPADASSSADPAAEARRIAAEEAARPFVLETGPLVRVRVIRLGPAEHAVACTLHHLISDGWSTGIFIREIGAHYAARAAALPPLPIQYADYAVWQLAPESLAAAETSIAWWREHLRGLPALDLPADFPRPPVQGFRGARVSFDTGPAVRAALADLARKEGTTPFVVALAAYQAALAAWSGQRDFAVGAPVAGRTRREFEPLVGFFVNTLVLRADLAGDPSFAELVGRTRSAVQAALARQDAPFDRLVEELNPERQLSHSPLVQAILSFENAGEGRLELPGMKLEPIEPEGVVAKFDLTLSLTDSATGWRGALDYSADLFAPASAEQFGRLLRRLLAGASARPGEKLSALLAPDRTETEELARLGRGIERKIPFQSIPALVAERARVAPEAMAIRETGRTVTYGELVARAREQSRALRDRGIGAEKVAAVCLPRSADLVISQLAVWFADGAYLPLDPSHPAERLRAMEEEARAMAGDSRHLAGESDPGQLAYVIYTSGSTGQPKGVMVSHGALANLAVWHRETFALEPSDVCTMIAGPAFDASVWEIWPALAAGACVAVAPAEAVSHPEALRDWLVAAGATISFVPTPMAELLLGLPWPEKAGLRWMLTGGDRLRAAPRAGLPFRLSNNYGPTEHAVVATSGIVQPVQAAQVVGHLGEVAGQVSLSRRSLAEADDLAYRRTAPDIGRPIAQTRVHLLDANFRLVPLGAVGEIFLSGPSVARGYLGRPDLTAELFLPDPVSGGAGARMYRTGDLARWRADGTLEFRGRADRQVKIRGIRIELAEVEAALLGLPGIAAAVAEVRLVGGESALSAWLVAAPDGRADEAAARAALRERLPAAMIPAHWVWLDRLPLTPNGKVDRRALPTPDPAGSGGEPPATSLERTIAEAWGDVLGRGEVGVNRSFFDIGGHSLLLIQVQSRLQAALGRPIPMLDLFAHPTVRALAEHLGGAPAGDAGAAMADAGRRADAQREAQERRRRERADRGLR